MVLVKQTQCKIAPSLNHLPVLTILPPSKRQIIAAIWNWTQCGVILVLMLCQLLTVIRSDSSEMKFGIYGRSPTSGTYAIPGTNDEPYSDRVLVCLRSARRFKVLSVNEALGDNSIIVESADGSAINGYRVVNRTGLEIVQSTRLTFAKTCSLIDSTLEYIISACGSLGYSNLTRDSLRVMDGKTLTRIPGSLPIPVMPYYDNNPSARFAIPAWDGHACLFHLDGMYQHPQLPAAYMYAVNRTVRESKAVEWLEKTGGEWKNGWYDDLEGQHWYSDIMSTNQTGPQNWLLDGLIQSSSVNSTAPVLVLVLIRLSRTTGETTCKSACRFSGESWLLYQMANAMGSFTTSTKA